MRENLFVERKVVLSDYWRGVAGVNVMMASFDETESFQGIADQGGEVIRQRSDISGRDQYAATALVKSFTYAADVGADHAGPRCERFDRGLSEGLGVRRDHKAVHRGVGGAFQQIGVEEPEMQPA